MTTLCRVVIFLVFVFSICDAAAGLAATVYKNRPARFYTWDRYISFLTEALCATKAVSKLEMDLESVKGLPVDVVKEFIGILNTEFLHWTDEKGEKIFMVETLENLVALVGMKECHFVVSVNSIGDYDDTLTTPHYEMIQRTTDSVELKSTLGIIEGQEISESDKISPASKIDKPKKSDESDKKQRFSESYELESLFESTKIRLNPERNETRPCSSSDDAQVPSKSLENPLAGNENVASITDNQLVHLFSGFYFRFLWPLGSITNDVLRRLQLKTKSFTSPNFDAPVDFIDIASLQTLNSFMAFLKLRMVGLLGKINLFAEKYVLADSDMEGHTVSIKRRLGFCFDGIFRPLLYYYSLFYLSKDLDLPGLQFFTMGRDFVLPGYGSLFSVASTKYVKSKSLKGSYCSDMNVNHADDYLEGISITGPVDLEFRFQPQAKLLELNVMKHNHWDRFSNSVKAAFKRSLKQYWPMSQYRIVKYRLFISSLFVLTSNNQVGIVTRVAYPNRQSGYVLDLIEADRYKTIALMGFIHEFLSIEFIMVEGIEHFLNHPSGRLLALTPTHYHFALF